MLKTSVLMYRKVVTLWNKLSFFTGKISYKQTSNKSSKAIFNISTIIALLKVRERQECGRAVLLGPEQ